MGDETISSDDCGKSGKAASSPSSLFLPAASVLPARSAARWLTEHRRFLTGLEEAVLAHEAAEGRDFTP